MENQRSSCLTRDYYCHGKSLEELKQSLLCATLELEITRVAAQEELRKRDDQLTHLRDLLGRAIRDRDEAQENCHKLLFEKFLIQQKQQQQQQSTAPPMSGVSSIEDEPRRGIDSNNGFSSSDCEESIVLSPVLDPIPQQPPNKTTADMTATQTLESVPEKSLPEKGKLLQAVMKAGPLLQTLLLAGPLPQWRHPPPPIDAFQIPPVTILSPPASAAHILHQQDSPPSLINNNISDGCGRGNKKRALCSDVSDNSSPETKLQRVALY